ncbi:hybrid sensor histidine kinase/response regulator [Flavipsychrobacter stenotrophus]|uniref:histidine kinase n=1 Tax=Flavipsychrobacter stenotrophus TaxID=2077091 RepID=A0A2S7SYQ2_9BACT|nr:response regulator [Flavipsychrobacter stenotrophus]PQJ11656.1 hybrid sensor histidine kinase/response regulator [Flavipsychrobacter stenotrophus]
MILIVDDKPENIFSLKILLETNGFEVDTALSGEEALKKILRTVYALVILDVQMPDMDGFEVAEAMMGYSKARNTPIIFLSAVNTEKNFIAKGYASGGIDYVTKPFDPDILMLKVRTFCRLYEQTRELHETQIALKLEVEVRRNAQHEQYKRAQELQSVMESIPQIAFTANADGVIEYVNEGWYEYADDKKTFPAVYNSPPLSDYWEQVIRSDEPFYLEVCLVKQGSKEIRYHLLRVMPVKQDKVITKWVGTFTDIHEQKEANETLEKKVVERTRELSEINNALEISNADLQQFASVASHDLKEPLRKIQVFSSIVRERYRDVLQPEIVEYFDKIIASSDRMARLINDLLVFSRLSVNSLFVATDINEVVKSILTDLEIMIGEKNATIIVDELPIMDVIPGQIRQVFQNLISNALKFSSGDVPPVINVSYDIVKEMHLDSMPDRDGAYYRISVKDNGIGFNELYLEKIFTIFQRLNPTGKYEGTGIGLAIAKKIIDKHNGIISARSRENEGAEFIVILPIHQAEHTN